MRQLDSSISPAPPPFMGVSLANRLFNARFARSLGSWVRAQGGHLDIILGDTCESVNYRVFRRLESFDALELAQRRAEELRRMFDRAARTCRISCDVILQSEYESRQVHAFIDVFGTLQSAYRAGGAFARDVDQQVHLNVRQRLSVVPDGERATYVRQLSEYVVRELALFYLLRTQSRGCCRTELYPGPQLMVKERLFSGRYSREVDLPCLTTAPAFVNVAFLALRGAGYPDDEAMAPTHNYH
jgi:tRNA-dependent cyclodipeptide synthase